MSLYSDYADYSVDMRNMFVAKRIPNTGKIYRWYRPKSGEFGVICVDTWQDSTSSLLMFEGMDLKCGVVNQTTHKRTHPHVHHILR